MWEPTDIDALPTNDDFIHANNAIFALEKELDETERRVQQLKAEIAARKAWIAPVRKLNDDVLSIVFVKCGRESGETALVVSAVCQRWRRIALSTPQVWTSLQIPFNGISDHILEIFLERRRMHLLHISAPLSQALTSSPILMLNAHAIGCISIPSLYSMNDLVFPNLTSLRIPSTFAIWPSLLTRSIFPALRHLTTKAIWVVRQDGPAFELPPLQSLELGVAAGEEHEWLEAVQSCQDSLLSLEIQIQTGAISPPSKLNMPQLERLQLTIFQRPTIPGYPESKNRIENWLINLIAAPQLKTYIQEDESYVSSILLNENIGDITHLRLHYVEQLPILPHLQVIQLVASLDECLHMLYILSKVHYGYSKLEYVEFCLRQDNGDNDAIRRMLFEAWDGQKLPQLDIRIYEGGWRENLPGFVYHSCGEGMACSMSPSSSTSSSSSDY